MPAWLALWKTRTVQNLADTSGSPLSAETGEQVPIFVFGYGSLVSGPSVSRTLRRHVAPHDLIPATLLGHRRDWGIAIPVIFDDGDVQLAAFLDVQPDVQARLNGVLIQVSEAELATLARREAQYEMTDVTGQIRASADVDGQVFTAQGRPEHRFDAVQGRIVLPKQYRRLVGDAVAARGPDFAEEFWRLTTPSPWAERDGGYRFHDPGQEAAARPAPGPQP